ncbi:hypothetical protein [Longimicrobium terrae]|uniref:Uncharacterized protein n=1 Tax=Longimicrobium terrae TaxID=1639882 RepID=A0A841GZV4_9BACT|nr:hypothetical protein [Longimicrobium terrae]MBB4636719.1 hypothetical protein [Longimicrobium terrae]MBB6071282.1 hypothetical protein [Longimicrobium terrae]NNC29328.1 hypothetical protein [Longimicrobium terrae]
MGLPKHVRLQEFYRRLSASPPAQSDDEMFVRYCTLLDQVEDELTGIPYDPSAWMSDGRLYPPQKDRMLRAPAGHVTVFRSRGHLTRLGENGAIEIVRVNGAVEFRKAGSDGRHIHDQSDLPVDDGA